MFKDSWGYYPQPNKLLGHPPNTGSGAFLGLPFHWAMGHPRDSNQAAALTGGTEHHAECTERTRSWTGDGVTKVHVSKLLEPAHHQLVLAKVAKAIQTHAVLARSSM